MKRYLLALLISITLISCRETSTESGGVYPSITVGTEKNGSFIVANARIIRAEWEKKLREAEGIMGSITSLEILKSKTTGKAPEDFYMLLAKVNDGQTAMATVLVEKEGSFYFDEVNGIITVCSSKCEEGCLPQGISQEGKIRLACGKCADCAKTENPL